MENRMNGNAVRVWTKQHENVLRELETKGRYVARREYIQADLGEHAPLVLEAYDWLVKHTPAAADRPADADYPIWVTLDPSRIVPVNIMKWGAVLDYSYIPADQEDAARHRKLLEEYRVSDSKAYMSQFYPEIKREIIKSWDRLFDARVDMGNPDCYGNIWEIKREWITDVLR